jgi:hypothetical protein
MTNVALKNRMDIRTGQRIVLGASVVADVTSPTLSTAPFRRHGSADAYVVPEGSRLILTGMSGRGGTVLGDYFELGEIGVSGATGAVYMFVPVATTPSAISEAGGGVNYWTCAAPLAVAVDAGEALHFAVTHAKAANASFAVILTGYLVDV